MKTKRLPGVTIIGTVEIIKGSTGLVLYFLGHIPEIELWITAAWPVMCIIKVFLGFGLLRAKKWARETMVAFMALLIFAMAVTLREYYYEQWLRECLLIGSLLAIIFIYYLTRTNVKDSFR